MARTELVEREISITQNALDRRDGVWHVWSNDPYWNRRLERVGAVVERVAGDGKEYTLLQRQLLIRKVPTARSGPRVIKFLERRFGKSEQSALEVGAEVEEAVSE